MQKTNLNSVLIDVYLNRCNFVGFGFPRISWTILLLYHRWCCSLRFLHNSFGYLQESRMISIEVLYHIAYIDGDVFNYLNCFFLVSPGRSNHPIHNHKYWLSLVLTKMLNFEVFQNSKQSCKVFKYSNKNLKMTFQF